ncbi:MAG: tetratricopeptide repeat protein [Phycisphaerae bacterium]|nr:tetratricopeptide repeat protein [Phycisphaerae bacterium]
MVGLVVGFMLVLTVGGISLLSLWGQRDPSTYVERAIEACRAGEMRVAIGAYNQAYQRTRDPRWLVAAGLVSRAFGDADGALRLFDKAVTADVNCLPAHEQRVALRLELVHLFGGAEGYANLRRDAEKLLALDPKAARAKLAMGVALAGLASEDPKYAKQSLEAMEQAHELAPNDVEIADALARRYESQDSSQDDSPDRPSKSASRAEEVYQGLIREVPDSAAARLCYAQYLIRRLKTLRESAAARGVPLRPRDSQRELDEVRQLLDKAAELDPASAEIVLSRAEYFSLVGEDRKAVDALSRAISSTPDELRLYVELARHLLEAGRTETARKTLEQGLARPFNPESYRGLLDRPRRHRMWCMLGESYLQQIRPGSSDSQALLSKADEARKQASIELTPDHWMGRLLLGRIRQAQGRLAAAVLSYREADRMLAWHSVAAEKLSVGLILAEAEVAFKAYGPAQETLAELLEHRPGDPDALTMRAGIDLLLGRPRNAAADADEAVKRFQATVVGPTSRASGAKAGQSSRGRQALRIWWVASELEGQDGDASRAQEGLSPLQADDHVFRGDTCYQYGLARSSEDLLDQAEKAYLAAASSDPTNVHAIRREVVLRAMRGRGGEGLPVVEAALAALRKAPPGSGRGEVATAEARLTVLQIKLDEKTPEKERDSRIVAALQTVPDPLRQAELLSEYYVDSGQAPKAVKLLNGVAATRAEDIPLLERQFSAALAARDWTLGGKADEWSTAEEVSGLATAEMVGRRAIQLNADGAGGRLYEGRLHLAKGLRLQAKARLKRKSDPASARQDDEYATSLLQNAVYALRTGAEDVRVYSMARVWLGRAMEALGQVEAVDAYQMALVLNPLNEEAHRDLARLGEAHPSSAIDVASHLAQAIRLARQGLDGLPEDPWLRGRAEDLREQQHPVESIVRREAIRRTAPKDLDNLLRLGALYRQTEQEGKADECLKAAVDAAGADTEVYRRVAESYALDKRYDRAIEVLERLAARLEGAERAEALLMLARTLQQEWTDRERSGATTLELRALRDRIDGTFAEAAKLDSSPTVCREAAEFCLRTERRQEAVDWLRRALRVQQDKLDEKPIREKLIRTLLSMRPLPDDVDREVKDYDASYVGWEEVSLFWGLLEAARGDLGTAADQLTRYLDRLLGEKRSATRKPGQLAEAYFLRGRLYLRLASLRLDRRAEFLRLAIEDLTRAKTYAPDTAVKPEYAIVLAEALERSDQIDLGLRELRTTVRDFPNDERAPAALVEMLGRQKRGELSEIRAQQETVIRQQMTRHPKQWVWPFLLGEIIEQRRARAEAEAAYRSAAELCNYGAQGVGRRAVVGLLRMLEFGGAYQKMIDVIEKKTKPLDRSYQIWTFYGSALSRTGRMPDALAAWKAAADGAAEVGDQAVISRKLQIVLGREKALQSVEALVTKWPQDVHLRMLHAVMLDQMERRAEAIKTLDAVQATATQPADRPALLSYLGTLRLMQGQDKQAAELFRKALEADKDYLIALNNLAFVLSERLRQPKEALAYARRAAELNPNAVGVLDTLGWCLTLTGDYDGALAVLEEAYSKVPIVSVCYHLAETYRRIEKPGEARRYAEQGLETATQTKDQAYQAILENLLTQLKSAG